MRSVVLLVVLAPAIASAEPPASGSVAVAVNAPTSWIGLAHAGSIYVGITEHHALRGNIARYQHDFTYPLWKGIVGAGDYGSDAEDQGEFLDIGASWTWFPRRLYDGFMLDLGVLHRAQEADDRRNETIAARAMFGVSHPIRGRAFIAWAVGASLGYQHGVEWDSYDMNVLPTTHEVSRLATDVEFNLRFGVVMR